MPWHKMWHWYLINFLSQWGKPDPLKPFPYSLWTGSCFCALRTSFPGTGEEHHHKRDLFAYVFPIVQCRGLLLKSQEDLQIQMVTPRAAFPQHRRALQPPCRRKGMAPACVALTRGPSAADPATPGLGQGLSRDPAPTCTLAVPVSHTLSHPPSQLQRKAFGKLNLLTALIYSLIPCGGVQHPWGGGQSWARSWWEEKAWTSSIGLTTSRNITGNYTLKDV